MTTDKKHKANSEKGQFKKSWNLQYSVVDIFRKIVGEFCLFPKTEPADNLIDQKERYLLFICRESTLHQYSSGELSLQLYNTSEPTIRRGVALL